MDDYAAQFRNGINKWAPIRVAVERYFAALLRKAGFRETLRRLAIILKEPGTPFGICRKKANDE